MRAARVSKELRESWGDLLRLGPHFCLSGLARVRRRSPVPVHVPGLGRAWVRGWDSDFDTLRQVFRDRDYALAGPSRPRLLARYEQLLAAGRVPIVLDAGANVGAATLWFSQQYPQAVVVAVEPDPDSAALLRRNVAGRPGVTVLEAALGGRPGTVDLVRPAQAWSVQTARDAQGTCPVVTVEDVEALVPGGELLLVKIDIEGFEDDLFDGSTTWLDRTFAVIIEPHDWLLPGRGTSFSFQRELGSRRFEMFLKGENILYVRP